MTARFTEGQPFRAAGFCSWGLSSLLLLGLGGFFLGFSGSVDDAHITFWSAWVLAHAGEIVNYNFDRVEQSSSLLQVLVLALLQQILPTIHLVTLAHVSTLLAALATLALLQPLARQLVLPAGGIARLLCASSPFFVYWACGGMEAPWLACLLVALPLLTAQFLRGGRSVVWPILLSLLAAMARPEMPLLVAALALSSLLLSRVISGAWLRRRLCWLAAGQWCAVAMLFGWRLFYFHAAWPQPVMAKTGAPLTGNLLAGLEYALQYATDPLMALPALLALVALLGFSWRVLRDTASNDDAAAIDDTAIGPATCAARFQVVSIVWLYCGFVLASGGDWMAAGRFWVPVVPLLAVLVAWLLATLTARWPALQRGLSVLLPVLLLAVLACHAGWLWRGTATDFNGVPLWKKIRLVESDHAADYSWFERHAREHLHDIPTLAFLRPRVAQLLQDDTFAASSGRRLRIISGQMGMVMFYLATEFPQRLQMMDRNGLVEPSFTDCPLTRSLPHTRNGLANGYDILLEQADALRTVCGIAQPDIVFDIDAGWNRHNIELLEQHGYVVIYRQRGHIADEGDWLPLRRIGAGQFVAVSRLVYQLLGQPQAVVRDFGRYDVPVAAAH